MSQGTLTDTLNRVMYSVMGKLQNEPTALMQSASRNVSAVTSVKFGSAVQSRVIGEVTGGTSGSYSVSMTLPEADSVADTTDTFALNAYNYFSIPLSGEEILDVNNSDQPFNSLLGKYIMKGFRERRNAIEKAGALAAFAGSSLAYGTAGTTPFATNYNDLNAMRKILVDNGCGEPDGSWATIMNTTTGLNLRNLAQLQQVNTSGDPDLLRRGVLLDLSGFSLRETAGIQTHTAGTGSGYKSDTAEAATLPAGTTAIHVDTGTGTILAGDIVTFAGDTNKYVVKTGFAGDGDGDIVLNGPGLRQTLADRVDMTIGASYTGSISMTGDAIEFASRTPKMPPDGDAAGVHQTITDPLTGLVWDYAVYKGKGTNTLLVQNFTGWKVWNSFQMATLLG